MAGHIAFFVQDFRAGGAERAVIRLVNELVGRGVPLEVVAVNASGQFRDELRPEAPVVELAEKRTATSVLGLARYIDAARPAAVVASMTHINVAAILSRALSRHKPRLVVVEHNQFQRNAGQKRGAARLAYRAAPWLYGRADVVAAVSEGVRASVSEATGLPEDRITLLYNPVVTPDLLRAAAAEPDHPWLAAKDLPVVLAVGRLMRLKNFPLLVDAFAELLRRRPARLVVLGEGELRPALQAQVDRLGIAESVDLAGFRRNPFACMRAADVFALSSDWEGHPTVMIEAMACGLPVVSTDCVSGPSEILEGGRYGRLVPPGDRDGFALALEAALADPGDPAPRIAHAKTFSAAAAADAYLAAALPGR